MRIQAMSSQGGGGGRQPSARSLGRQGSIYSLTLTELENHLGEPLHSMSLEELLKTVLQDETDRSLAMSSDVSAHRSSGPGIQNQESITMTRALSKKTVDEVWREIQQKKTTDGQSSGGRERQTALGDITLEDFLVKAGVVAEGAEKQQNDCIENVGLVGRDEPMAGVKEFGHEVHWLHQHHQMYQEQQQDQERIIGAYVYPEAQMSISPPMVETSSDPQTPGRKRRLPGDIAEKSVERRQKRMIKNRESAARSRARKQAYTNELENKISRLEKENERLKKQRGLQIHEQGSEADLLREELDMILCHLPRSEPKHHLRRYSSSPL